MWRRSPHRPDPPLAASTHGRRGVRRRKLAWQLLEPRQYLTTAPMVSVMLLQDTGASGTDRISSETDLVGSVHDDGNITSFTASFSGAPAGAQPVSLLDLGVVAPNGNFTIDLATLQTIRLLQFGSGLVPDGAYTLTLRAGDNEGKFTQTSISFTRDTQPPTTPTFKIATAQDPEDDGQTFSQFVILVGGTSSLASVTLDRDGTTITAELNGRFQFNNVQLFPGVNSIGITAVDTAGNVSTFSRVLVYTPTGGPNTAPSFTKGADVTVPSGSGPQSLSGWATAISPGTGSEAGQVLTFLVSVDRPGVFTAGPAISPTGTLSFTLAPSASGTAVVSVRLMDDGGTVGGGIDTSPVQTFNIQVTPAPTVRQDTVGFYDPASSTFFLRNSNSQGLSDAVFPFGKSGAGWVPLVGDWNGDGRDTVAFYDRSTSTFFLKNSNAQGVSDLVFSFGPSNSAWIPLAGDWNGDGQDSIGFYDPASSTFFLRNANSQGLSDTVFSFGNGNSNWQPLVGDWNGDGQDTVGFYNPASSTFFLKNSHGQGLSDLVFNFGVANSGWRALAGDWNSDQRDGVGFYDPASSNFFLKNANAQGLSDAVFSFGVAGAGWVPLVGDWNGPSIQQQRLAGDANGDGLVGAADYAIWAAQYGQTGAGLAADFDGNGTVGAGDYALWAANLTPAGAAGLQATAPAASPAPANSPPPSVPQAPAGLVERAVDELLAAANDGDSDVLAVGIRWVTRRGA